MAEQTNQLTTKQQLATKLEGIMLGRTLHDLEKQAGVSAEALLRAVLTDEEVFLAFKTMREISAYVIEDDITTKLKANAEAPESAVKNNALKVWADHMHWAAERRNPAVFSGKAAVNVTVPIQIHTDIDMNQPKTVEGVYELAANIEEVVPIADLEGINIEPAPVVEPPTGQSEQFGRQLLREAVQEVAEEVLSQTEQAEKRSLPARRHRRVDKAEPAPDARVKSDAAKAVPGKKPRPPGAGAHKKPRKNEAVQ